MLLSLLLLLGLFLFKLFYLIHPKVFHGSQLMHQHKWTLTSSTNSASIDSGSVWCNTSPVSTDWESAAQVTRRIMYQDSSCQPGFALLTVWHHVIFIHQTNPHCMSKTHLSKYEVWYRSVIKTTQVQAWSGHSDIKRTTDMVILLLEPHWII